jgi:hypothetical protein
MTALYPALPIPAPRPAIWFALALALAAMVLPDCCLNGSHAFGSGMDGFGPICRAVR